MKQLIGILFFFSVASLFADNELTLPQIIASLRAANEMAKEAVKFGHQPFGAVLLAPDNETILMRQGHISLLHHAEIELVRRAADMYPPDYLATCTLVTTAESCAMCSGAIYYSNIRRVVYGLSRATVSSLIGSSKINPPLNLPSRTVFQSGQKPIQEIGPIPEMEAELSAPHKSYWK